MKNIVYITLILIILPIITMLTIKVTIKEEEKQYKYIFNKNTVVRVKREEKNRIDKVPLEQYLIGVLAGEMPVSYNIEALKAQAVAARTYTLKKIESSTKRDYDIVDTTNDQVYLDKEQLKQNWKDNYEKNIEKIEIAIKETEGEYLTYDNKIIQAFFFSTSSGNTENCEDVFGTYLPYLVSVSSTWDENSPSYKNTIIITKEELYEKLNMPKEEKLNIEIERNKTNSINLITINNKKFKGTDFRNKLKLRSTNIEIEQEDDKIKITSKGFGHGVGMSQYGALELSKIGYSYDQILKYYYQGTEIKKIEKNV
jgi:stage II sporulation protein D